jgi:hypothetical protein
MLSKLKMNMALAMLPMSTLMMTMLKMVKKVVMQVCLIFLIKKRSNKMLVLLSQLTLSQKLASKNFLQSISRMEKLHNLLLRKKSHPSLKSSIGRKLK